MLAVAIRAVERRLDGLTSPVWMLSRHRGRSAIEDRR
ncbi:uncharacterized protein METZ01_LOCUS384085 [marine metagenome]|uniref:Uncharacterized protein n=1 Tax=marine metagenome TaxID=408172 RepID=A0A382UBV1_9ZZZZ